MSDLVALAVDPAAWLAFATLVVMEIVLGVDNLVFVAILSNKLPYPQNALARRIGIGLSLIFRILLLAAAGFIVKLTQPVFAVLEYHFSWRDLILIAGGVFLVWKATTEIHESMDISDKTSEHFKKPSGFRSVVAQIVLLDIVFSIDSIITAVGMTEHVPIMIVSVIVAVVAMLLAADSLAKFIHKNPTIVMLALGFLLLIGTTLIADGFGFHFPKGYIYVAMAFSGAVEGLNMLARSRRQAAAALVHPPASALQPPPAPPQLAESATPPKKRSARKRGHKGRRR
ncbi:TerC family protein [Methylocapsa aurea]|uniref:TerC family protein n=1 Tax=Methylocapsa aurea TaxID=663610 RepID=UPI0012EB1C50|nr:TerC family protein [Methylocapsa aurea]